MKKAAKVMYILAIVWSCFSLLSVFGMFGAAYLMKHYPSQIADFAIQHGIEELNTIKKVLDLVNPMIIAAVVALVISIVMLIFGIRALKMLEKNALNSNPHIVMIVLGAVFCELFYLLGGIFGTIGSSQNKTQTPPQVNAEEKAE